MQDGKGRKSEVSQVALGVSWESSALGAGVGMRRTSELQCPSNRGNQPRRPAETCWRAGRSRSGAGGVCSDSFPGKTLPSQYLHALRALHLGSSFPGPGLILRQVGLGVLLVILKRNK